MPRPIRGRAARSAHRSRGYWGPIWRGCGIQSGFIPKFHLIASVSHHSFSGQNITCFHLAKPECLGTHCFYPKIEDAKLEVGALVLSIPRLICIPAILHV